MGPDGQTADEYAANLEANLQSLLDRFKSGQYVAPPVRRVHIPKGDGRKTRPIGGDVCVRRSYPVFDLQPRIGNVVKAYP